MAHQPKEDQSKEQQLKDKFLKDMVKRHTEEFIDMIEPEIAYKILSAELDKELIVRRRESDFVAKAQVGRRNFLFHLEFISQYRRKEVRKACGYGGALSLKYDCDVATILFVLKPPSRNAQGLGSYDVPPFGKPLNRHDLAVVRLWELRDAILSGDKRYSVLVPLLPELSSTVDKKLLQRQRELIDSVKDPARRSEMTFYAVAFAQDYFSTKFLMNFFEGKKMMEHWEQVPIFGDHIRKRVREGVREGMREGVREGVREGEKRGEKKGRHEGMTLALQENILEILSLRFGLANGPIARTIHAIDKPEKLKTIFRRVVKTDSLEAVKKILAAERASSKKNSGSRARR